MKVKPVGFSVACNKKPYIMMAVDLPEVFANMQLTNWYLEHGFLVEDQSDIFQCLFDKYGYYEFLKAGGHLEV